MEFLQQVVIIYLAGNRSYCLKQTQPLCSQADSLVAPQQRDYLHLGEAVLGEPGVRLPGVLFAAATFHFVTLGCENDVEVAQIIKQLQCPILGHWKCTFFLQMNSPSPAIKGDDLGV